MKATLHLACSPLSGEVHVGTVTKDGRSFRDGKQNITSDFLRAVIEKADFHGGEFEIRGSGGTMHFVRVRKEAAK